jgi:hypothetical protein
MAFKVFLTYGAGPGEQVTAWRLQTLATSQGLHVTVPHHNGSGESTQAQVHRAISQSDCVLAIITNDIGPAVADELNYALAIKKPIIPLVWEGVYIPPALEGLQVLEFNPWNTGVIEQQVIDLPQQRKFDKEKQQTIAGLVAIGLGLVLIAAVAKK